MIKELKLQSGTYYYMCNESLCCMIRINYGQAELVHLGAPVAPEDAETLNADFRLGWGDEVLYADEDMASCMDIRPLAFSCEGNGDYRDLPLELFCSGSPAVPRFEFSAAEITDTIPDSESSLPRPHGEAENLRLIFRSCSTLLEGLELSLDLTLFDTALTRRCVLKNACGLELEVTKFMSSCWDLKGDWVMTTFDGGWIRETHKHTVPVSRARVVNESTNGSSSSRHNPGFLLGRAGTTESAGEAMGFNLIWSGNHYASAQNSGTGYTRVLQGINPEGLRITLAPGESLETPEAVISWSREGYNGLSRSMHCFVSEHIVPEYWAKRARPVLYNSWEGCMFDFTETRLMSLARKAAKLGCELFVLDDGWFGARNDDHAGLGDYNVNRKKLPGGLERLSEKLHGLGLQFGLWFEPEAVNPDSDCFREHPDWALGNEGVRQLKGRNELLLDLTKPEVRDYIVNSVSGIIDKAGVDYVKWDMNRCSPVTGTKAYEYILGLYEIEERIFGPRPQVLLEGCSSGGNRFDLGMLCFAPQIWASDDTDPIERLDIQSGLSYLYPQSTFGAHISAAPHAQTLRQTPLSTRANVAFFGDFGLEFDLEHMLPVDEAELKDTIAFYKEHREAFQFGAFSRGPAEDGAFCWQVAGEKETICGLFHTLVHAGPGTEWLAIENDRPEGRFRVESRPQLLRVGQFGSLLKHVAPVEVDPNGVIVRIADRNYKMADGSFSVECSGAALGSGIPLPKRFSGTGYEASFRNQGDFGSNVFVITQI